MKGTGSYAPCNIVTNDDLATIVDTSDEWIRTRTGICERRITKNENTSQLAYVAGLRALENAKVSAETVDLIVCATLTPDSFTPATACIVQDLLGANHAVAYDLNAACTGFVYGIATAMQFIETGVYKNALVIGAETLSKIIDWTDRNTCVLFGDGAGAVYLERSDEESCILDLVLSADGSKRELLECDAMPITNPFMEEESVDSSTQENAELVASSNVQMQTIHMLGGEVFKFAVKAIVGSIKEVLDKQNLTMDDIDWIVPHQANIRIIESAAKLLKADFGKFYMNLERYGNTSSASIAIALDELNQEGKLKKGQKVLLVGFGGGMTSGAILAEW